MSKEKPPAGTGGHKNERRPEPIVPSSTDTLQVALSLARVGWHIFPARRKLPLVSWADEATSDAEQIATWWSEWPDAQVGIHAGKSKLAVVDIDAGDKRGAENLAAASITLPTTLNYATPSGGEHHVYRAPAGDWTVAQNKPVPGVDLRAGTGYAIYYGPELLEVPKLATAPTWALIARSVSASTGTSVEAFLRSLEKGKPSPAVKALLAEVRPEGMGHDDMLRVTAALVKAGHEGEPGVAKALRKARGIYTANYPTYGKAWDDAVAGSVDRWGPHTPLTVLERPARPSSTDEPRLAAKSVYVDVRDLLNGGMEPIETDAGGVRTDGCRLLYRGKVNGIVGESGAGKTITAACMAADEIRLGGSVLWADLDHNGAQGTVARLIAAGVTVETLTDASRFRLAIPESREELAEVVADAVTWRPTVAVVDSVGEVIPMFGGTSNDADDYTTVHREVFAQLAKSGAAVLLLDHLAKTALTTGYASGTGAKKRAMDGAYFGIRSVEAFKPGVGGAAALTILKDRWGSLSAASQGDTAALLRLDSRHDTWTWEFYPAKSSDEKADEQLEADVAFILALEPRPTSKEAVIAAVKEKTGRGWRNDRAFAALREARSRWATVETLVKRQSPGLISESPGLNPENSPGVPTPLGGDRGLGTEASR